MCAKKSGNTLIGLEDDGNILAEDAQLTLQTMSRRARQCGPKSSRLYGGPIVTPGPRGALFSTMSGSTLVASALGPHRECVGRHPRQLLLLALQHQPRQCLPAAQWESGYRAGRRAGHLTERLHSFSVDKSGTARLQWNNAGLWYTVEFKTNLTDTCWTTAPESGPRLITGGPAQCVVCTQRFYESAIKAELVGAIR